MKIRNGFVSNSSSSSFCIYGIYLENDPIITIQNLKKLKKYDENIFNEIIQKLKEFDHHETVCSLIENLKDLTSDEETKLLNKINSYYGKYSLLGLEAYHPYFDDSCYIGKEWCDIKDKETGAEFKEKISNKLKILFGDEIKCNTYQEAWYNG